MKSVSYLGGEKNGANFEFLGSLTLKEDFLELVDLICLLRLWMMQFWESEFFNYMYICNNNNSDFSSNEGSFFQFFPFYCYINYTLYISEWAIKIKDKNQNHNLNPTTTLWNVQGAKWFLLMILTSIRYNQQLGLVCKSYSELLPASGTKSNT